MISRRREAAVLVAMSLLLISVYAARPTISYRALELGAGALEIGLVGGAYGVFALLGALPIGRAVDRFGPARFTWGGCLIAVTAGLIATQASTIVVVAVAHALFGLGQVTVAIAVQTMMAGTASTVVRDGRFARLAVTSSLGGLIGPIAAGALIDSSTTAGTAGRTDLAFFAIVACSTAALGIAVVTATAGRRTAPGPSYGTMPPRPPVRFVEVLRRPGMVPALLASLTLLTAVDIFIIYLPVIGEARGVGPAAVGAVISIRAGASLVARLALPLSRRYVSRKRLLVSSMMLGCGAFLGYSVGTTFVHFVVLAALLGIGVGVSTPLTTSWVAGQAEPEQRGVALAMRLTGNRLAGALVPPLLGSMAGLLGVGSIFVVGAAIVLLGTGQIRQARLDEV